MPNPEEMRYKTMTVTIPIDPRIGRSRTAVLQAAVDLVLDGGLGGVTLDAVSARAAANPLDDPAGQHETDHGGRPEHRVTLGHRTSRMRPAPTHRYPHATTRAGSR
jgi:hypothetical protein